MALEIISIHAPPRGATDGGVARRNRRVISIHAPPRGATTLQKIKTPSIKFQFTPLREGRPTRRAKRLDGILFQFTPLREGRLNAVQYEHSQDYFNSRPSARGDAFPGVRESGRREFQFTPLREGRRCSTRITSSPTYFNSRPSARGDTNDFVTFLCVSISIHAPPRGATAKDMQFLQIFCSTLTNQHGLTIVPRNLSRLFW